MLLEDELNRTESQEYQNLVEVSTSPSIASLKFFCQMPVNWMENRDTIKKSSHTLLSQQHEKIREEKHHHVTMLPSNYSTLATSP
jgi:hypothetical protein